MLILKNKEVAQAWCEQQGHLAILSEIDFPKINSNCLIANQFLESATEGVIKKRWNPAYTLYYDALHLLVESLLVLDKVKSKNHQCLFTYLCVKHPELEFDWDFFEKVRTKRNGIHYYGNPITEQDWKSIDLQLNLYISTLKKELEHKLKER